MSERQSKDRKPLVCRRCDYATEVLRPSCPACGGEMIYEQER